MSSACVTLTPDEMYSYAVGAGFPCDTAAKLVAIAMKESAGQTCAHNSVPPDDSYGLWQINMYKNLLTPRLAQFGISSPSALFDPAVNAAAAYALWAGNDNNLNVAWAINDGSINQQRYQANLPAAQAAAAAAGCSAIAPPDSSISDLSESFLDPFSSTFTTIDLSSIGLPADLPAWYLLIPVALLAWAVS